MNADVENVRAAAYTDHMDRNTLTPDCPNGVDDAECERGEHDQREGNGACDERDEIEQRECERQLDVPVIDRHVTAGWAPPTTIEIGASAEQRAVYHLEHDGYRIVERNFKTKLGELDIVARDRAGELCFIEVRSRTNADFGNAAESVNHLKRGKVTKMAQLYLTQRQPRFDEARFDVVALTGDRIDLIRDAWRLGDRT
jgi:putative endonuclease